MPLRFVEREDLTDPDPDWLLEDGWWGVADGGLRAALTRWRFGDRPPGGLTCLALHGDRCVGMIDSFRRPYSLEGRTIFVRETCDWFCLPAYRPYGVGVALMRRMMTRPEPILSIGGTDVTRALLPRLNWVVLPGVRRLGLPLKARALAASVLRRRWPGQERIAKLVPDAFNLPRPYCPPRPVGGHVRRLAGATEAVPAFDMDATGLTETLAQADRAWLAAAPMDLGEAVELGFWVDGKPVGYSYSWMAPSPVGKEATIFHLRHARRGSEDLAWMIGETVRHLADDGANLIRCRVSDAAKLEAYRKAGFLEGQMEPAYWWAGGESQTPTCLDVGWLRADDALPVIAGLGRPPAGSSADQTGKAKVSIDD